jgi:hypothetical protein
MTQCFTIIGKIQPAANIESFVSSSMREQSRYCLQLDNGKSVLIQQTIFSDTLKPTITMHSAKPFKHFTHSFSMNSFSLPHLKLLAENSAPLLECRA